MSLAEKLRTLIENERRVFEAGQKSVDLTGYQKKIDEVLETESKEVVGAINELNEGKLDKQVKAFRGVYGSKRDGTQILTRIQDNVSENYLYAIPIFYDHDAGNKLLAKGVLITDTPDKPYQCANKKYVDDNFLSGLYLHKVSMLCKSLSGYDEIMNFNLILSSSDTVTINNWRDYENYLVGQIVYAGIDIGLGVIEGIIHYYDHVFDENGDYVVDENGEFVTENDVYKIYGYMIGEFEPIDIGDTVIKL